MKELWQSITKKEWRIVAAVTLAVVVLTGLPYLYGYLQSTPDRIFIGWHAQTPVDFAVYISYIKQIAGGNFLVRDLFTTEPQPRAMLNVAWLAVGLFARIFNLDPRLAFHLACLLFAPFLLFTAYLLIALIFREIRPRLTALFLLAFAGGWGFYGLPVLSFLSRRIDFFDRTEYWPADLDITESYIFSAIYQSPHFIMSWTFLLLTFLFYLLAFTKRQSRYFLAAGLAALIFFNFHPYYFFLVLGVTGLYFLYGILAEKMIDWRLAAGYGLSLATGAVSVIYHWQLIVSDPLIGARAGANVTMVYFFLPFFFCFGAFLLFGGAGIYLAARRKLFEPKLVFCLIWIGVSLVLIFTPNPFQRHYYEGLFFPLMIFSVIALMALGGWLKIKLPPRQYELLLDNKFMIIMLFFFVFCLSNAFNITRDLYYFSRQLPLFYLDADDNNALNWLARQPKTGGAALAGEYFSHLIPGFTGQTVFAGHGIETLDYNDKKIVVAWFFSGNGNDEQKENWLKSAGIGYIFYSPEEKRLGGFAPAEKEYLKLEKQFGQTEIYRVKAE